MPRNHHHSTSKKLKFLEFSHFCPFSLVGCSLLSVATSEVHCLEIHFLDFLLSHLLQHQNLNNVYSTVCMQMYANFNLALPALSFMVYCTSLIWMDTFTYSNLLWVLCCAKNLAVATTWPINASNLRNILFRDTFSGISFTIPLQINKEMNNLFG